MNNVRRILIALAVIVAPSMGCTFGVFPRESNSPAIAAAAPCYSGDICADTFSGASFGWIGDVRQSSGH